ncbi:hypothetical protein [Nitrosomonas sp. HPC101]|uniref:hypothetical protein n=1 Tax=Nitrosomonas sp. HPC101 TaxID=1658667 RepID=UPI00136C0A29|nr:hypothetical protein [Nitrosomonas sp. HPC101]
MWSVILSLIKKIWSWLALTGLAALLLLSERRRIRDQATRAEAAKTRKKEIDAFIKQKQFTDKKVQNAVEIQATNAAASADDVIGKLRDKWSRD